MSLTVLAAAQMLTDDVDAWGMPRLRALLPVAGMTVIEQQAMRAQALGAVRLLVQVDSIPTALAEALERVRARGLPVEPIRDAVAVARLVGTGSALLIVADGLVADDAAWRAIGSVRGDTLMVANDSNATQAFERLDPQHRWIGLAMVAGESAAALAQAPDGWDAQLTLLREVAAGDAARLVWDDSQCVAGAVILATDGAAIITAERQLLALRATADPGIGRRWLAGPLLELAGGPLLGTMRSGQVARWATVALASIAAACLLSANPIVGIAIAWLAAWSHAGADFIARFRPESKVGHGLAIGGSGLQLASFALFERGAALAPFNWGTGGIGATMMLALAMLLARHPRAHWLPDLLATWPVALLLALTAGYDVSVLATSILVGLLLLRNVAAIAAPTNAV
jgi:hypothetical protein